MILNCFQPMRCLLLAVTGSLMITACMFLNPPLTEEEQVAQHDAFIANGGYAASALFEIDQLNERWWQGEKALDVSLLVPRGEGYYPLIIYLPGLGEPVSSGRLWREHWAKAGYAVLSVQPENIANAFADLKPMPPDERGDNAFFGEENDKELKLADRSPDMPAPGKKRFSQAALDADMRYIGREFFAAPSLSIRISQVLWAYRQSRQLAEAKLGLFAHVDLSRVLIVGYDLGAQTAAALIGEKTNASMPENNEFKAQGAILISPSVDLSSGELQGRYRPIHLPLLVVSSEQDNDPYGITTPTARRAVWDYAASEKKYLLLLKQADHQLLSGAGWSSFRPGIQNRVRELDVPIAPPDMNIKAFQGGLGQNGFMPPGGMGRPSRFGNRPTIPVYRQVAAVASVSTAFIDSIAKPEKQAAQWLAQAPSWLKSVANLTVKNGRF